MFLHHLKNFSVLSGGKNRGQCSVLVKGSFGSPKETFTGHWQLHKQTIRYVTCIGVQIPSRSLRVRHDLSSWKRAITRMRPNRDCHSAKAKTDTGDNDTSVMSSGGVSVTGVRVPWSRKAYGSLTVSQRISGEVWDRTRPAGGHRRNTAAAKTEHDK